MSFVFWSMLIGKVLFQHCATLSMKMMTNLFMRRPIFMKLYWTNRFGRTMYHWIASASCRHQANELFLWGYLKDKVTLHKIINNVCIQYVVSLVCILNSYCIRMVIILNICKSSKFKLILHLPSSIWNVNVMIYLHAHCNNKHFKSHTFWWRLCINWHRRGESVFLLYFVYLQVIKGFNHLYYCMQWCHKEICCTLIDSFLFIQFKWHKV